MSKKTYQFSGQTPEPDEKFPYSDFPRSILLVGYLEDLKCQTPLAKSIDAMTSEFLDKPILELGTKGKRKNPSQKALVCASDDGRVGFILSPNIAMMTVSEEKASQVDGFQDAVELHTDFHGVGPQEIKKIDAAPFKHLEFFGWLNHIVYSVPQYSERRGLPFIHEARDRGDDLPKAENKPYICLSPNRDLILMYGDEMCFTDRGFIG